MSDERATEFTQRKHIEPIFHPQMRQTREVIRRPEWVKRTGEGVAHRGSLNSVALFGILFANCVGGGYGFEDGIGAAGPLITLIVCIVLPWIWSFPTGLAVAELSTAVPSNSGVLMWTNAAFPPFISFMCILMTIFITFVGNATYPNLTSEYVGNLTPLNKGQAAGIKIAVIVLCCVLNCVGVEIVGSSSIILCAITITPFMLLTCVQLFGHGFNKAVLYVGVDSRGVSGVNWADFFSIISWNYANIENAGSVVEEIANPRKTLPRSMMLLMFGTYVAYVMPMLAGVSSMGVGQDYTQWKAGHWPDVAKHIAGDWLKYMLFAGAMLSGVGFTLTSMCCTSRLLAGMGTMEMFPKRISRVIGYYHPKLGTPIPAVVINSCVTIVFSASLEFGSVVSLCQSFYCLRLLLIYAALIRLRIQYPKLARPFALPCSTWMAALALLPAAAFSLMAAIVSAMTSLAIGIAFASFVVGGSVLSWVYCRIFAKNGFQGVIVQCAVSDDDDDDDNNNNNSSNARAGENADDDVLNEGVFYHDGETDLPGDTLLGILPLSADSGSPGTMLGTLGADGSQAVSPATGAAAGSTSGDSSIVVHGGKEVPEGTAVSAAMVGFGATPATVAVAVDPLPGLRRRGGGRGGVSREGESDEDIELPMYAGAAKVAAATTPVHSSSVGVTAGPATQQRGALGIVEPPSFTPSSSSTSLATDRVSDDESLGAAVAGAALSERRRPPHTTGANSSPPSSSPPSATARGAMKER